MPFDINKLGNDSFLVKTSKTALQGGIATFLLVDGIIFSGAFVNSFPNASSGAMNTFVKQFGTNVNENLKQSAIYRVINKTYEYGQYTVNKAYEYGKYFYDWWYTPKEEK